MNVICDSDIEGTFSCVITLWLAWYSQRPVDDSLDLVHNVVFREQVIGVPAQWNIIIVLISDWDLLGSLRASSPGGRKSREVDCGPTEQAEYCVGRGAGGLHHNAEKMLKKNNSKKMVRFNICQ